MQPYINTRIKMCYFYVWMEMYMVCKRLKAQERNNDWLHGDDIFECFAVFTWVSTSIPSFNILRWYDNYYNTGKCYFLIRVNLTVYFFFLSFFKTWFLVKIQLWFGIVMQILLDSKQRPQNFTICAVAQRNIIFVNFLLGFSVI